MTERIKRFQEFVSTKSIYFPSAEIYFDNHAGFYEYGPIGNKIRLNIIDFWRKEIVQKNDFLEISGSMILPKSVFEASGHLKKFDDPIATCSKCKQVFKLDKLLSEITSQEIHENLTIEDYEKKIKENNITCPLCKNNLEKITRFNLMAPINIGATEGAVAYLRGETCQSIFIDFLRIYKTSRRTLPIGVCQHGKVYRNEISPRNGLLRCREFEQLECELFFNPKDIDSVDLSNILNNKIRFKLLKDTEEKEYSVKELIDQNIVCGKLLIYYLDILQKFLLDLGFSLENMRFRETSDEEKAFYSKQTFDLEILSNNTWIELFSFNYRTDYDLTSHSKGSKKDLSIVEDGNKFTPHVLEVASIGLDRLFYLILENNFKIKEINQEQRNILSLKPKISPYFVAVLPLVKKDGLLEKSQEIYEFLKKENLFEVFFDEKGSIGKRYARLDEIGCNYCITIDHQTIEDETVTLRDRDTFEQKRVSIKELKEKLFCFYNF
jgi:glycyl-tRNA synthetase